MIRQYLPGDHLAIAGIFTSAIREIAAEVYSEAQCRAWSERRPNPEQWERRCREKRPWVYAIDEQVAGFLELDPDGHIDCAYVNPRYRRRGVVSALVRHAMDIARKQGWPRLYVEASLCAKPLFEKLGFTLLRENWVTIDDQALLNFHMEYRLSAR